MNNSNKFWQWLVQSSTDPTSVALSVKGVMTLFVPYLMQFLPILGVHPSADFSSAPDAIYGIVYYGFTIVGAIMAVYGFGRKLLYTIVPGL